MTKAERILNDLENLESNWMHKTQNEKVDGIRMAVVSMNDGIYYKELDSQELLAITSKINHLMLFLMEVVK